MNLLEQFVYTICATLIFLYAPPYVQRVFAPEPPPPVKPAPRAKSMYAAPTDCPGRQWIRHQADDGQPWHECVDADFRSAI